MAGIEFITDGMIDDQEAIIAQLPQERAELLRFRLVQPGSRLVEQHDARAHCDRSCDFEKAQFAKGQHAGLDARLSCQPALDRQLLQKEAERATSAATIGKIEALIPLLQQQVDVRKTLFEHETGSKILYVQTMQQLVEPQQELAVQKSKLKETEAAVAGISTISVGFSRKQPDLRRISSRPSSAPGYRR